VQRIEETRRPTAFRSELRAATRVEHQALDRHPAFVALAGERLGIDGYAKLMSLFHGLYAGLDDALGGGSRRLLPADCGYAYQRRQPLLARDLEQLGAPASDAAPAPGPYRSLASLCGALYVVEGSVLGGAMLQRATGALLSSSGGGGDGYWRWCRDAGGTRWGATCGLIEMSAGTSRSRDEMVATARDTFNLFSGWLGKWHDETDPGPAGKRLAQC
jgi:heme oxygenase